MTMKNLLLYLTAAVSLVALTSVAQAIVRATKWADEYRHRRTLSCLPVSCMLCHQPKPEFVAMEGQPKKRPCTGSNFPGWNNLERPLGQHSRSTILKTVLYATLFSGSGAADPANVQLIALHSWSCWPDITKSRWRNHAASSFGH
jgi:hypothetical protein